MFKKFAEVFLICALCFTFFSCDSSSAENVTETSSSDFTLNVYARNGQAYFSWGKVKNSSGKIQNFNKIKIEYESIGEEKKSVSFENGENSFFYIISKLENQKEYNFTFTGYAENQKFSKITKIIPQKTESNVKRLISLCEDGHTYINFTLPQFLIGSSEQTDFTNVNVYTLGGEKIPDYEAALVSVYEPISSEIKEDSTKTYQKYFSVYIQDGEYSSLEVRLSDSNNNETESFTVVPQKATLPVVKVSFDYSEDSLEKLKNKKKIDSTLSTENYSGTNLQNVALTVKGRGNSSWQNAPKKSYTIKFSEKQKFLDFDKNKSFALVANYFDKTLLRNISAYELATTVFTNMAWAPSVKPVHLFVNGVYSGIYGVTETVKIGSKRVNIKDISDCENVEDFENYGYILEIDERMEENLCWKSSQNVTFNLKEPDGEDLSEEIQAKIKEKVNSVEEKLYSDGFNDSSSENYYENYLDSSSFVDWWLLEELAKNTDSNFYSSCYMYYNPEQKKFFMGPVWDFDLGFGNINSYNSLQESYSDFKTEEKIGDYGNWILRLREDSAFTKKVKNRWAELKSQIEQYFSDSGKFEQNYNKIQKDSDLNFSRYEILGTSVWKSPTGYESRTTYLSEKEYFLEWIKNRIEWLDNNL